MSTTDIVIRNFPLFFLLNKMDNKDIIIKKNKSISSGEMERPLPTVTMRRSKPFIKFDIIKNNSSKKFSFITITSSLNFLFVFIHITTLIIT